MTKVTRTHSRDVRACRFRAGPRIPTGATGARLRPTLGRWSRGAAIPCPRPSAAVTGRRA